jgi:hypothetical protein
MTDDLERRIQAAYLRAHLPPAPESLHDLVLAVPATEARRPLPARRFLSAVQAAAVVVAVLLAVGALAFLFSREGLPAVDPIPSTTMTPTGTGSPSPIASPTMAPTASPNRTAASDLPPIEGTEGWWVLWQTGPTDMRPDDGVETMFGVPPEVTTLGVLVRCSGAGEVRVALYQMADLRSPAAEGEVACPTGQAAERLEFPIPEGAGLALVASTDAPVRAALYAEGDSEPVWTYPSAPPLPAVVADTPYAWASTDYVAVGTLGSNRQKLIRASTDFRWPIAAGDHVAFGDKTPSGTSLRLASVSGGRIVGTLAEVPPDRLIERTWVDAENGQVFFVVGNEADNAVDLERVGLDGSGRRVVASVPAGSTVAYELALDSSVFVVDSCRRRGDCSRLVVDAATLEVTEFDLELDREICNVVGATDGLVLVEAGISCSISGADRTLAMRLDGSESRVLDFSLLEFGGSARLVRTTAGPHVVGGRHVVDLSDGSEVRVLEPGEILDAAWPYLRLPPDWVLFVPFPGLADFPRARAGMTGQPPVLVNVLTGDSIEMVNLPH